MVRPVVFLNGPPRSGKDTLGEEIVKNYPQFALVKFAKILKERTHALYGQADLPHDYFENVKGQPHTFFKGLTPRRAYINVSQTYFKPVHGESIFGDLLLEDILTNHTHARGFVITDCGFECETGKILSHFGAENSLLVRIHAAGRGCSFLGDSRDHISLPVETMDITNDHDKADFLSRGMRMVDRFLQPVFADLFH